VAEEVARTVAAVALMSGAAGFLAGYVAARRMRRVRTIYAPNLDVARAPAEVVDLFVSRTSRVVRIE
jgi:3-dehydroquinate synthetase